MSDRINQLRDEFGRELATVASDGELTSLRDRWIGRKSGLLTAEMKTLGQLSPEEKRESGQLLNQLKNGSLLQEELPFGGGLTLGGSLDFGQAFLNEVMHNFLLVTLTGGTGISISGIGANSILGNCSGVVATTWTNPTTTPTVQPSSVSFSNHSIPGSPSTCYITGTLVSSPNLTVTP